MRKWRSHKVIEAEEIFRVEIDSSDRRSSVGRITVLGGEVIEVPRGFFARNKPTPGDFLVRYEDGYLSWSPRGVFLAGNSEIEPDAPHRATGVPPGYPGGGPAATGDAGNGGYETATGEPRHPMTDRGTFDHRQADFGAGDDAAEREFYEALKRPDPGTDMEEAWPTLADLAEQSEASMMLPIATLVSATLYTAMVFAAGVAWGNRVAACLAIATAGASYLCYLVQVMLGSRRVAEAIMILSIVTGAFAGLSLLAGF